MSSPFIRVNAEGRILGGANGKISAELSDYLNTIRNAAPVALSASAIADEPNPGGNVPVGGSISGVIDANGDLDQYTVNLVAGQTYLFSLRGTGLNPINDSLLSLINPAFTAFVAQDDDGGNALYSIITYTATETGLYTIRAQTFANANPDVGGYTIDVRQQAADTVGSTIATAGTLSLGTNFGFIETSGDVDRYAIQLEAGKYYTFSLAGGADYETDYLAVPAGELDTILILRNAAGAVLTSNDDNNFPTDISSGLGFYAETSGTYYIDARAYAGQTGGYALAFETVDLSSLDPLDSLDWGNSNDVPFVDVAGVPTAYVYFGAAGENFGETGDDGVSPMVTFGWTATEITAVMLALEQFEQVLGVNYVITTNLAQATFRLSTTSSDNYGAYFYPQDPGFGSAQGIGVFNIDSGGWTIPGSLDQGGYAFGVILHEFGHGMGLAHPHDTGGGSDLMVGVTGPDTRGIFDLNQGVYTVMSYNDAWETHPDGPSSYSLAGINNGWSGTLSAFDIAQLQTRYGTTPANTGNTNYALTDVADDAFYRTIWDTAGIDTISYAGLLNARIDLTAATIDYTPTGGGVVSFVLNLPGLPQSAEIKGGYTIANGVVIENATGGSGNDVLIGNAAANVLTGNAGNDTLIGRGGKDFLVGGAGADMFVFVDTSKDTIRDFDSGVDKIDLSAFDIDSSDVKLTKDSLFADTNGDGKYDLHIVIFGEKALMSDIDFGSSSASASFAGSMYGDNSGNAVAIGLHGSAGFNDYHFA